MSTGKYATNSPTQAVPGYRREIDGMRAIAVLAVVLYHFSVPGLGGGFVGVDVFFVISGFLIGGILWREQAEMGRIALVRFYMRRFRRLAPAYFAVVAATLVVGWFVLLPFEFRELGKSAIAATVYLSNVLFFRQSGYFDTGAEDKILLHTWSLAVEEQFYIFLPLCLILLGARAHLAIGTLWGLFALSLVGCFLVTPLSHNATFYLFPFRAWELLAGVLLAITLARRGQPWALGAWVSWAGLALVLGGIVLIEPGAAFPGWQAVVPVLGTVLLIMNGQADNPVNRVLSMRGPVWIGLISYSLYLWHWPILTLSSYWRDGYDGPLEIAFWLTVTGAVSWASWRFIERPVREVRGLRPAYLFGGVALCSGLVLAAGSVLYLRDGLPSRFDPEVRGHIAASQGFLQDWSRCRVPDQGPLAGLEVCPIGPEGQNPVFLAWGDSHLRAFKEGLDLAAHEAGQAGLLIWRAGCPPLFGVEKTESAATRQQDADCAAANAQIEAALDTFDGIRAILTVGRWTYYAEGSGTGRDAHNRIAVSPAPGTALPEGTDAYTAALASTVERLAGEDRTVLVLRQPPEIPEYDSRVAARLMAHGRLVSGPELEAMTRVARPTLLARTARAEAPLQQLAAAGRITLLDTWPALCGPAFCSAMPDGRPLYFDNNHVTNTGARTLRHVFAPLFAAATGEKG